MFQIKLEFARAVFLSVPGENPQPARGVASGFRTWAKKMGSEFSRHAPPLLSIWVIREAEGVGGRGGSLPQDPPSALLP